MIDSLQVEETMDLAHTRSHSLLDQHDSVLK